MALYKDFEIEGGTVTLNMEPLMIVVNTGQSLWYAANETSIVQMYIEDGRLISNFNSPTKDESPRVGRQQDWREVVTREVK